MKRSWLFQFTTTETKSMLETVVGTLLPRQFLGMARTFLTSINRMSRMAEPFAGAVPILSILFIDVRKVLAVWLRPCRTMELVRLAALRSLRVIRLNALGTNAV